MRDVSAICLCLLCSLALAAEPETYVIAGTRYYAVDEDALRKLGLPRRDIPDAENGGLVLFRALENMPPGPQELDGPIVQAMTGPWRPEFGRLKPWLDDHDAVFATVRKAVELPDCQFPVLSKTPDPEIANQPLFLFSAQLPHLAQCRQIARVGRLRGLQAEHTGDPLRGLEEHRLVMSLGAFLIGRDFVVTDLVGIACETIGWKELTRCAVSLDLPADAWAGLAERLDEMRAGRRDWSRAIQFEKVACVQAATTGMLAEAAPVFRGRGVHAGGEAGKAFLQSRAARILLPDRTVREEIESYYDRMTDAAKLPAWEGLDEIRKLHKAEDAREVPAAISEWNVIARTLLPAISRFAAQHVHSLAQLDALRIAVALRRYGLAHNRWPGAVEELAPRFLGAAPLDPFTGKPYRYELKGDGWRLWSAGRNREDDGGDAEKDLVLSCDRRPWRAER